MVDNSSHTLWSEKYRPTRLEDFVIPSDFRNKVTQWIEEGDLPHLLLAGPAGTGKTSLAYFLRDNISPDEHSMTLNASNENSVDVIRNKVQNFSMGISFGGLKICIMDECDYLSINGQAAFRNVMETYSAKTRFILTCNYPDRIITPLKSRCQTFNFAEFDRTQIIKTLATIMVKEKVKGTAEQLALIADSCGSDIRKAIGVLQYSSLRGKLTIDKKKMVSDDYKYKVVTLINEKKLTEIRELLSTNMVRDFAPLYSFIFNRADDITIKDSNDARLIIAEYLYRDALVADKEVTFAACILEIMKK